MMATKTQRETIRTEASERDCRYRITAEGEVHFHGKKPNSIGRGWWLFAQSADEAVARIEARAPEQEMTR